VRVVRIRAGHCRAPNSASRFAAIGNRLKIQPIQFTFSDGYVGELNYSVLIAITLNALYGSARVWEDFAQLLADLEGQVNLSQLGARLEPLWEMPGYINKRGFPRYRNTPEGRQWTTCAARVTKAEEFIERRLGAHFASEACGNRKG